MLNILIIYTFLVNAVDFVLFGVDKWKAKHSRWRIPEAVLLAIAVIGGSLGALLGMRCFHHKNLHRKFSIGIPLILLLQIAAMYYFG